jgi:DNA-sulfur modification-associated
VEPALRGDGLGLRPEEEAAARLSGVATRPDTNHRHHAIIRFHKKHLQWIETTGSLDMAGYNPNRDYGLLLYTDDFAQEAHRFYVYNYLGSKVPTSAAHYIESKTQAPAIHAKLARRLMESSGVLGTQNVEIMANQLSRNSAKMLTFGTLTEALRTAFPAITEEEEFTTVLDYLVHSLDKLHEIRPNEIGLLSVARRQQVRDASLTDQAILWHGYFHLANWLWKERRSIWREDMAALGQLLT